MEREKAARLLTKNLVESDGRKIVFDDSHKDRLVKNSDFVYVAGEPKIIDYHRDYKKYFSQSAKDKNSIDEVLQGIIPEEANYLFASKMAPWGDIHMGINIVPYVIIGKEESTVIKERFYKGDDLKIREAVESLDIPNYFWIYNLYSTKKLFSLYSVIDSVFQEPAFARAFANKDHSHISKFKNVVKEEKDMETVNSLIKSFGVRCGIFTMDIEMCTQSIGILMDHLNKYSDFFKFVFKLPPEEQDVETNRLLLKRYPSMLSIDTILLKEYLEGEHFKEYFEALEGHQKGNVVNLLKGRKPNHPDYDSLLFHSGFKEVMNLSDYKSWYEKEPEKFIKSFKGETREKKVAILKEVYGYDSTNEEVINWLNKNELELVREVGFDG